MSSIHGQSISELQQRLQSRELSCEELIQSHIDRIKACNDGLNALVSDRFALALEEARQLDRAFDAEQPKPPLWGMPMTCKDTFSVVDLPWTSGLKARRDLIGTEDAESVAKLRAAGAILLGKSNVPEAALWIETDNRLFGRTNSPFDINRTPGGSSGGEAALLAMGATSVSLGSDAGGSVRIPAHFCGVCGHKPTPGRIAVHGHFPYPHGALSEVATVGPLARNMTDLQLLFDVLDEGRPSGTAIEPGQKVPVYLLEGQGLSLDSPVQSALNRAADILANDGHDVLNVEASLFSEATDMFLATLSTKAEVPMSEVLGLQSNWRLLQEMVAIPFGRSDFTAPSLAVAFADRLAPLMKTRNLKLVERLEVLRTKLLKILGTGAVILAPVFPTVAPVHGAALRAPKNLGLSAIFNALGFPATAVPLLRAGKGDEIMPAGVQVIGGPGCDERTLHVAAVIESHIEPWQPQSLQALGGYNS